MPALVLQLLHAQVRRRAVSRGAVAQASGAGSGQRDEFGEVSSLDVRIDHQQLHAAPEDAHRREVCGGVVGKARKETGRDAHVAHVDEAEGVAIGRTDLQRLEGHDATCGRAVLDDDGLAEQGSQFLGNLARGDIGNRTRRDAQNELHRARGIGLGIGLVVKPQAAQHRGRAQELASAG